MITNEDNIVLNAPLINPSAPPPDNENNMYHFIQPNIAQEHQIIYNQGNMQNPAINVLEPSQLSHKAQFQKRLVDNYPTRTVLTLSSILLFSNVVIFLLELTYRSILPNNKENVYKTMVVSKYLAYAAFANVSYGILGLLSVKYKRYFLIQIFSILSFMGIFASIFYFVVLNLFIFIVEILMSKCTLYCVFTEIGKIFFGIISTFVSILLFFRLQIRFLNDLNNNAFNRN